MIENLDFQCACHAKEIADGVKEEDTIGKTLGVLQEDGLYAFYLYSLALERKLKYKEKVRRIIDESSQLLMKYGLISNNNVTAENVKDIIAPLASNIDHILLAKELLERTLIYARYHAKALGEGSSGGEEL